MHAISSRWRKPKGRPSKRRKIASLNAKSQWNNSKLEVIDESVAESFSVKDDLSSNTDRKASVVSKNCYNLNLENKKSRTESEKYEDFIHESKKSRTEEKFSFFSSNSSEVVEGSSYSIIHESTWNELLKNLACENCGKKDLTVNNVAAFGFSTKLELSCTTCSISYGSLMSSPRLPDSKKFAINKDMVAAFLEIGKGFAAMESFAMALGIKIFDRKTFDKYVKQLAAEKAVQKENVLEKSREIVREAHRNLDSTSAEEIIDICVSFDGSWQKRGHTSYYCIGSVIDMLTGLVIDYVVLSKYCQECTKTAADLGKNSAEFFIWYEGHKSSGSCQKNYEGSSGSMEVQAADILWRRSIELCKMRYTVMLSDGDSKSFIHLSKSDVYEGINISKEECLNHVAKRLGTALRNKVKEWRTKGECLGGRKKGSLTDEKIVRLTNYYRKAIKDNAPDVNKMKTAIFASLHHCMSSDNKPQHQKCPFGKNSWCFYNKAVALGTKIPEHSKMKTTLSENVVAKVLPVYQRLACSELLEKCSSGKTQNSNESLHSVIWKFCSKDVFTSKNRLEIAAVSAVSRFNMGCEASLSLTKAEIIRGPSVSIAKKRDQRRLTQSVYRQTSHYKNSRKSKKSKKNDQEKKQTKKEGASYGAGLF